MFDVCDWNDSSEAQSLTESLVRFPVKAPAAHRETDVAVTEERSYPQERSNYAFTLRAGFQEAPPNAVSSRKKRLKRTRELMEILRTLEIPNQQDPQDPPSREKQKKRRPEQDPHPIPCAAPQAVTTDPHSSDTETRLNRQQWRNKQKNRKKSRNKFKKDSESLIQMEEGPGERAHAAAGAVEREHGVARGGKRVHAVAGAGKRARAAAGAGKSAHTAAGAGERANTAAGAGKKADTMAATHKASNGSRAAELQAVCGTGAWNVVKRPSKVVEAAEELPAVSQHEEAHSDLRLRTRATTLQKRRLQKLKKILGTAGSRSAGDAQTGVQQIEEWLPGDAKEPKELLPEDRSASLRSRMEQRLQAARFRYINQQLYTSDSHEALRLFQTDPEAFTVYHAGFSQQVQRWPVNPINEIIKYIKNRSSSLVVADFGCGEGLLAQSVRNTVHSFDLVAVNEYVTACDMARVPLTDETVDIAVFCLSLMGNNLHEFLQEASRVLKMGGVLLVAEVSSRFDDVRSFLSAMSLLGFKNVSKSTDSSYFFLFEFIKYNSAKECVRHPGLQLSPCLYKKR